MPSLVLARSLPGPCCGVDAGTVCRERVVVAVCCVCLYVSATVSLLVARCSVGEDPHLTLSPALHCGGTSSPPSHTPSRAPLGLSVLAEPHLQPEGGSRS